MLFSFLSSSPFLFQRQSTLFVCQEWSQERGEEVLDFGRRKLGLWLLFSDQSHAEQLQPNTFSPFKLPTPPPPPLPPLRRRPPTHLHLLPLLRLLGLPSPPPQNPNGRKNHYHHRRRHWRRLSRRGPGRFHSRIKFPIRCTWLVTCTRRFSSKLPPMASIGLLLL